MNPQQLENQIAYMQGVTEKAALVADASNTAVSSGRATMCAAILQSLRELHTMKEETRKLLHGFGDISLDEIGCSALGEIDG